MWTVKILIKLKKGVLDAQGKATHQALLSLGFQDVKDVKIGKLVLLQLAGNSQEKIEKEVQDICHTLLVNPVIEDYEYEIKEI